MNIQCRWASKECVIACQKGEEWTSNISHHSTFTASHSSTTCLRELLRPFRSWSRLFYILYSGLLEPMRFSKENNNQKKRKFKKKYY
ncbi:hypothetical protein J6590_073646 [Homalodisca vitripennis]|nr:hypothetical protein J6590_073646 [Homalodisca vitripennis]